MTFQTPRIVIQLPLYLQALLGGNQRQKNKNHGQVSSERKQENRINTDVGKNYEVEGILARMILQLLDEASMGNMNEYEILFLPCYISAE